METGEPDWREGRAETLVLSTDAGPLVSFLRRQPQGAKPYWAKSESPQPGRLTREATPRERLTPEELLEALRGPLGAETDG